MNKVIVTKRKLMEMTDDITTSANLQLVGDRIAGMIEDKNKDYGDAWQRYGVFTPLIRINDKILRIETLSSGQQAMIADESIEDNLRDIVAYGLLALLYLNENDAEQQPS